jgi:MFS family permease
MDAKVSEGFHPPQGIAASVAPPVERAPLTHAEKRIIAISMMVPVFLGSVDQSIMATSLPTIGRALNDVHNLPWLVTAYLIAATALTPLYGKFADIHGRRAALLIALSIYMLGCIVSATSGTMLMLIFGRLIQGCGGGGLTAIGQMILGDIASPKERAKYYAFFSIAFTSAGGCGPLLGGWICDHLVWWMIFLWSFPLSILAVVLALTILRRLPRHDRPHQLDFLGALLVIASSSSFMLALNLGGVRYSWFSSPVIALLACALVVGGGFVARLLTAKEPLIPIAVLVDPSARLAMLGHSFGWGSIMCLNIFLPMYLQSALGWSATASGASVMILMVTLNATAGFSSPLIGAVNRYKLLPNIFQILSIVSILALAYSASGMTALRLQIILFLIGVGWGPTAPLTQVMLQNTVALHHLGSAIGTMNFARTLMSTILVAVFGAFVLANVPADGPAGSLSSRMLDGASITTFTHVFIGIACTMTVAFIAMLMIEEKPLGEAMPAPRR